ncbi:signal peptidase I [Robertkochia sediminum]|uniref:signal peptidase I n=1 Tax=Robertkochia sediminum TaxID=2785326 RepID=UPI00193242CC|nr:signal peptidase I [Robertkochia sediminum]MBL7473297.1 signal peptidase I [Robertkochia sediminum]
MLNTLFLVIVLFLVALLIYYLAKRLGKIRLSRDKLVIHLIIGVLLIWTLRFVTKALFYQVYFVPSDSMASTINKGDKILVDKRFYLKNSLMRLELNSNGVLEILYRELYEIDCLLDSLIEFGPALEREKIILFRDLSGANFVKRCIAVSGDSLQIEKKGFIINNNYRGSSPLAKRRYKVTPTMLGVNVFNELKRCGIECHYGNSKKRFFNGCFVDLTTTQFENLTNKSDVMRRMKFDVEETESFHFENVLKTVLDSEGKLYIPSKGDQVILNDMTFKLYGDIILKYEGCNVKRINGGYFNGKEELDKFTFNNNYIFVLGDNFNNSLDSREFGLIPEHQIVGEVELIF